MTMTNQTNKDWAVKFLEQMYWLETFLFERRFLLPKP